MWVTTVGVLVLGVATWHAWPDLRFWWRFAPLGTNAEGCPEYRHRKSGIVFVQLPPGEFLMGSVDTGWYRNKSARTDLTQPEGYPNEYPQHTVTLGCFLIAKYEVTQAEWQKVMGMNPSRLQKGDDLPVHDVSWEDCSEFCRRTGLRFPSEAQWEYACRAGTTTPFAGSDPDELGWHAANSSRMPHQVGEKKPNGFGLHDMHGNVYEWCEDFLREDFYGSQEASLTDPVCTSNTGARVFRGGGWNKGAKDARSACRSGSRPEAKLSFVGFRPAYVRGG